MYYTHVFILPAVILALLVPFTFILPPDCKERLTLGKADLTLKAPITNAADDIHKYLFIVFQRK